MDKALLEDKVLMGEVNRTLLDPAAGGQAERIANLHAYQISAVLSVLQWARKRGGVLAPAEFLWLKPYNRPAWYRSEEHTSELQSLMRISYAVFCLTKKKHQVREALLETTTNNEDTVKQ